MLSYFQYVHRSLASANEILLCITFNQAGHIFVTDYNELRKIFKEPSLLPINTKTKKIYNVKETIFS